jgi:ribosomal protein S6
MLESENEIGEYKNERVYELGYLLVPTISEEDLPATFGNLKELVSATGGMIISDEMPKTIPLAYKMVKVIGNARHKFSAAYFGWIKFTMDTEKILELKKKLDLDPNLIRFLVLKTVKENTIASKRFIRGDMAHRRQRVEKNGNEETAVPINKEEIDKEIDALVAA